MALSMLCLTEFRQYLWKKVRLRSKGKEIPQRATYILALDNHPRSYQLYIYSIHTCTGAMYSDQSINTNAFLGEKQLTNRHNTLGQLL